MDELLAKAEKNGVKVHLPVDFVCAHLSTGESLKDGTANVSTFDLSKGIPSGWNGVDAGKKTAELFG